MDLSLSFDTSICSTMAFPSFRNCNYVIVSVSIDLLSNSKQDALFQSIAYDNSNADWDSLFDHLRDVLWKDVCKFGASAAASESERIQVGK